MIELSVCIGSACHLRGSYNVLQTFQHIIEKQHLYDKIELKTSFCMQQCGKDGIAVKLENEYFNIKPENAKAFFAETVLPMAESQQ